MQGFRLESEASTNQQLQATVMSQNTRNEALAVLAELAALAPEVRLGQLMAHIGFLSQDQIERSLWDVEDDELLAVLHRHRSELRVRQQGTPSQAARQTGGA